MKRKVTWLDIFAAEHHILQLLIDDSKVLDKLQLFCFMDVIDFFRLMIFIAFVGLLEEIVEHVEY